MEIILQNKIPNLGNLGDKVNVKAGYARNYLFPQGLAVKATEENLAKFEERFEELKRKADEMFAEAKVRAEKIEGLQLTIQAQASEEGKLYGSVGTSDIVDALAAQGLKVAKKEVSLPNGVLRLLGDFTVTLNLHSDVSVDLKLQIVAAK